MRKYRSKAGGIMRCAFEVSAGSCGVVVQQCRTAVMASRIGARGSAVWTPALGATFNFI